MRAQRAPPRARRGPHSAGGSRTGSPPLQAAPSDRQARAAAPAAFRPRSEDRARAADGRAPPARDRCRRGLRSQASSELTFEQVGQTSQTTACPRLDRAERNVEKARNLALREAAPVRELEHLALVLR